MKFFLFFDLDIILISLLINIFFDFCFLFGDFFGVFVRFVKGDGLFFFCFFIGVFLRDSFFLYIFFGLELFFCLFGVRFNLEIVLDRLGVLFGVIGFFLISRVLVYKIFCGVVVFFFLRNSILGKLLLLEFDKEIWKLLVDFRVKLGFVFIIFILLLFLNLGRRFLKYFLVFDFLLIVLFGVLINVVEVSLVKFLFFLGE